MRATLAGRGRPACAVVSVGGLTVGGAGKTPLAARLARALHERGWRVAIASRGYKGAGRERVTVVSDGRHVVSSVAVSGDESLLLAAHAPGVPVLVGRDRRVVAHRAVAAFDAQIVVLDDGFQHHRVARDLDLVCIDGASGLGNRKLLPAGPLREPVASLRHADWLCLVDGDAQPRGSERGVEDLRQRELVASFEERGGQVLRGRRQPKTLVSLDRTQRRPLEWLSGRRVGLLSGVGQPGSVRRTLESLGACVVSERRFRDHHAYAPDDLRDLDPGPSAWLTTEKDALKILPEWLGGVGFWVLTIEFEIEEEDAVLDRLEAQLREVGRLAARSAASA